MIEVTGERWDDEYVDEVWHDYVWNDGNYCKYIQNLLNDALDAYVDENGPLTEDDGTPVSFPSAY